MELTRGDYKLTVNGGLLKLFYEKEKFLTAVTNGEVKQVPYESIGPRMASSPILKATYAGDGTANVDMDAGAMRWSGDKSLNYIRKGLYKADFTKSEVDSALKEMKKTGP